MSMTINVIHNNPTDNKSIVSEKKVRKNLTNEKFYLVENKNIDKFIKCKQNNEIANKFQKGLSLGTSLLIGGLIGMNIKSNNLIAKIATAAVSAIGSLVGFSTIDLLLDKSLNKITMKKFNAEEITKETADKIITSENEKK
ncbi:hypothetical protein IJ425_04680 [bacterium]|nr:hypothetical protein [bacterium]